MSTKAGLQKDVMRVLKLTSRTFYIPITLLKTKLKHTVASAYLCMRAIDEIEDHEQLDADTKVQLLNHTSKLLLNNQFDYHSYRKMVQPYEHILPEVTLRLGDWIEFCPIDIVKRVKDSTSEMASGMAKWVKKDFQVHTKDDLDEYTYFVAGLVGVMLSDIWEWYDGTQTSRNLAIGYGRGLQAVNMLRNEDEDAERGVGFFPDNWTRNDMFNYAEENLKKADQYIDELKTKNIILFCKIPLALARKTLKSMSSGKEKMSRQEVESTVEDILDEF